jgi:hypothetical protein
MRTAPGPEEGLASRNVETRAGPVDDAVEDLVHDRPVGKEHVVGILHLVDGVVVAGAGCVLFGEVQGEGQHRRVDPAVAHLAQAPYSRGMRQGLCDPRQACRFIDDSEAVALLPIADAGLVSAAGDVVVTVQDDLCPKGRVAGDLDHHVSPVGIEYVEAVVVDEGRLLLQVDQHPRLGAGYLPCRRDGSGDEDHEHSTSDVVAGQVLLGDQMLALAALAVDEWDGLGLGECPHSASKPSRQAQQMGVIEIIVTATMPSAPPDAKPARRVAHGEVPVEDQTVHTVVGPLQQTGVPSVQVVFPVHVATLRESLLRALLAARRAPGSELVSEPA